MGDVEDDDGVGLVGDLVADAPVTASAGRMLTGVFVPQRMANTVRVIQERAGDELGRGCGDLFRQASECALCPWPDVELPAATRAAHAAPVSFSR